MKMQALINKIMSATICAGVSASMTGRTMTNKFSHYVMRLGTMKKSCAENLIAQKKKQIL